MIRPLKLLVLLALLGCKENLATPPTGSGPDLVGPTVQLYPAHDTLTDSTGVLLVRVSVSDRSGISKLDLHLLPGTSTFGTLMPLDTVFEAFYPIPLAQFKHGTFRFYARSFDLLDHETVTDTVTVTVR